MALTTTQIENIPIDYGLVYIDFGEVTERFLGPTKGGSTLKITKEIRDIEFDGSKGKSKRMQVVDKIDCSLVVASLDCQMDNLAKAMPWITYSSSILTAETSNVGVLEAGDYFTNIVVFVKLVGGGYKKITLYNPMNESDFEFAAAPKAEGMVSFEFYAHWDPTDDDADLFKIEDVETLGSDTTDPTCTLSPANSATGVAVDANITATFSEAIKSGDVTSDNFVLSKAGVVVAGSLTYNSSTYVVTLNPTSDMDASTEYVMSVTNVRDLAGNKVAPTIAIFTTTS